MTEPGGDLPEDTSRYARPIAAAVPPETGPTAREIRPPTVPEAPAGRPVLIPVLRAAGPPAALAILATLALGVAVYLFDGQRSLAVNTWLLAIGGLVLWTCWRALAQSLPASRSSAFDSVRRHSPDPQTRLSEVIAIEGVILDAEWSWSSVEHRLRPLLRQLAANRLLERRQVDMELEPSVAHRILGDEVWALVGPGAYGPETDEPTGRLRRGISRAAISHAVTVLEEL